MMQKEWHSRGGTVRYWCSQSRWDAPWLIFLPGLTADHTLFEPQLSYFADSYNCLVWDAPAHGLSRPFSLDFTLDDLAEYLHEILLSERIERPVLIGQSMGGYLSQAYILRYPDTVSAFISIDSCSLSRKYYSRWELALLKKTKGMYMAIPWKLLLWWGIRGTARSEYGRKIMAKCWSVYRREEYCSLADHGYRILAEAIEAREAYPLSCPVLLLCGEKDAAGSAKRYNRRWHAWDGYPLIWLKDAGHNANTDVPEIVNREIQSFLAAVYGQRSVSVK